MKYLFERSYQILMASLLLIVAYHLLLAERYSGIGLLVFLILYVACVYLLVSWNGGVTNRWASLFLIPLFAAGVSSALYASEITWLIAVFVILISAVGYVYWVSAHSITLVDLRSLFVSRQWLEVVFPIRGFWMLQQSWKEMRGISRISIGVLLALPVLVVIGMLFAEADPLFKEYAWRFWKFDSLPITVWRFLRDLFVFLFFASGAWMLVTRRERQVHAEEPMRPLVDATMLSVVLWLVNALFLVFVGFQAVYFFGGQSAVDEIARLGLTYAEYARQGFFQLLEVTVIVCGLVFYAYATTQGRELSTRIASLLLMVQTSIVIASAVSRLALYVDAYGLTVARWYAAWAIVMIACTLALIAICLLVRWPYRWASHLIIGLLLAATSATLFWNVELNVANWNVDRYLSHKTTQLDLGYLSRLSTDVVPALLRLPRTNWDGKTVFDYAKDCTRYGASDRSGCIEHEIEDMRWRLKKRAADVRDMTWSDYRARSLFAVSMSAWNTSTSTP